MHERGKKPISLSQNTGTIVCQAPQLQQLDSCTIQLEEQASRWCWGSHGLGGGVKRVSPVDIGASPLIPSSVIMLLSENSPNSGSRYEGMGARCVDPSQSGMLRILSTQAQASAKTSDAICSRGTQRG